MRWILLSLFYTSTAFADSLNGIDTQKILDKIDKLYRADSSYSVVTMNIKNKRRTREMRMKIWSKGDNQTLIRIEHPPKDQGTMSLKKERNMWNYFPKIDKMMRIPPSMMMASWMGTDFTYDDLVKENKYISDFNHSLKNQNESTITITLTPKPETVTIWKTIDVVVDRKELLPREQIFYDDKGEAIRKMVFSAVKILGGRNLPSMMKIISLRDPEKWTEIQYNEMQFGLELKDSFFSKLSLRKNL